MTRSTALRIEQGDITRIEVDAIVNAANSALAGGGGVDGAIHRAGGPSILHECRRIGHCPTGSAVITGAGHLKARYVIHAVAPIYSGAPEDAIALRNAYEASLQLAVDHNARSIAFPSLGTGVYGYPIEEAAPIAVGTVAAFVAREPALETVTFVLFNAHDYACYERHLAALKSET